MISLGRVKTLKLDRGERYPEEITFLDELTAAGKSIILFDVFKADSSISQSYKERYVLKVAFLATDTQFAWAYVYSNFDIDRYLNFNPVLPVVLETKRQRKGNDIFTHKVNLNYEHPILKEFQDFLGEALSAK